MLEPEQTDTLKTHVYYKRYSNHSKAAGICWAILTLCFLIINIIVFIEPQWIGDSTTSAGTGWIGLYEWCELFNSGKNEICQGQFQDFTTIMSDAFRASTFFIGVSILIIFLCILLFIIFFFKHVYRFGYIVCGCLQAVSTVFMFLGCVIFPHGWDNIYVQRICGMNTYRFHIGDCTFRWAYMLAIIGIFDIFMITILAFVLAFRTADKMKEYEARSIGTTLDRSKSGSVVVPSTLGLLPPQGGTLQTNVSSRVGSRKQLQSDPGYTSQPVFYADDSTVGGRKMLYSADYPTNDSQMMSVRDAGYTGRRQQHMNGNY